jgi:F420-non-reducing hydrogenase iron-sulfur subunit
MTTNTLLRTPVKSLFEGNQFSKFKISIFHCANALYKVELSDTEDYSIRSIGLPCSSMTREAFLLKAFESGADAVLVMVCPENSCHYLEGNIRAIKRVNRTKNLLDEIGLDGRRLNIYHLPPGDQTRVEQIINETLANLKEMGLNPAA